MITKAVIPAAGLGSRLLPGTKIIPKVMLPIVDKPVIQLVVEEIIASGVQDILIITNMEKSTTEEHFLRNYELEKQLKLKRKEGLLIEIQEISNLARISTTIQAGVFGLGDAVLCAEDFVGGEPFAILLGDTIVNAQVPCLLQLIRAFEKVGKPIIGVDRVDWNKVNLYGIIKAKEIDDRLFEVENLIEKPKLDQAPSNLAISGRYILDAGIFNYIRKTKLNAEGEIQLTDALCLFKNERELYAYEIDGIRYDIGSKLDFILTNIDYALQRKDLRDQVLNYMKRKVKNVDDKLNID